MMHCRDKVAANVTSPVASRNCHAMKHSGLNASVGAMSPDRAGTTISAAVCYSVDPNPREDVSRRFCT